MYTEPELNHFWMTSCIGFLELSQTVASEKLAELELRKQMTHHKLRTDSPHMASVFYLPIFEFASWRLGSLHNCSGASPTLYHSHYMRMVAAAGTLRNSSYWQRCLGCDHIFVSSNTDAPNYRIFERMKPLSEMLVCATAGRYKARAGGGCQTEIPYRANPYGIEQYDMRNQSFRTLFVSFSGSLDVCCSGQRIRCAIGRIILAAREERDVSILISVRDSNGGVANHTYDAMHLIETY